MVSLKQYLDSPEDNLLPALLDSYQRLLLAAADCNSTLCPQSAGDLSTKLRLLEQSISLSTFPAEMQSKQQEAELHLNDWHDRTRAYLRQKATEIKDLMMLVAKTAESVGERDATHNHNLKGLTERLKGIAELEDVTRLRSSLIQSVEEMTRTVEQMSRESEQTMRSLEVELSNYRSRLEQTEQAASVDALTGLANRRHIETELAARMRRALPFALLLIDLNDFKQINDTYGHLAGDQILRQFSGELKQVFRKFDLVGRWGGDEFLAIISGQTTEADSARERIEEWVWGTYPIKVKNDAKSVKVHITAAIGVSLWKPGLTTEALLSQADADMYHRKAKSKSA